MKVSEYGLALVKHFEGCRLHPYLDAVHLWTIGWGRRISDSAVKQYWNGVSQDQADKWFNDDIQGFALGVTKLLQKPVEQHEFDAVVSLAYNIGIGALKTSTMLRLLNEGDKNGASKEFRKWCHAGAHVLPGLLRRRTVEQNMFDHAPNPGESTHDYITFLCGQG